eukprot:GILK01011302.1.p1 GENE.GILK01011302.1~~GILK01011302.1.p1  ORF type:complete len:298 (+),score=19.76 GILK01011302.1:61-954(+)
MSRVALSSLVSASIDLAERAGRLIREVVASGNLQTVDKGVDDPQTIADIRSQRLIVSSMIKAWPGLQVIGEEELHGDVAQYAVDPKMDLVRNHQFPPHLEALSTADIVTWVDPLDATKEFTLGRYEAVTTLIGITHEGSPVAGVIHQPFYQGIGRTIWGVVGVGTFGLDRREFSPERNIVVTTSSHPTPRLEKALNLLRPDEVVRIGGAGHKALFVLEGHADSYLFPSFGTKKWDVAAADALFRAVGGTVTDIYGNPFLYTRDVEKENRHGLLMTLRNHDNVLAALSSLDTLCKGRL